MLVAFCGREMAMSACVVSRSRRRGIRHFVLFDTAARPLARTCSLQSRSFALSPALTPFVIAGFVSARHLVLQHPSNMSSSSWFGSDKLTEKLHLGACVWNSEYFAPYGTIKILQVVSVTVSLFKVEPGCEKRGVGCK